MFKLDISGQYEWPVTVEIQNDGQVDKYRFTATFKRFDQETLDDMMHQMRDGDLEDAEAAQKILIGWKDVQDEAGKPLPYSEANKKTLLNTYPVRPAVIRAWIGSMAGQAAKRKN